MHTWKRDGQQTVDLGPFRLTISEGGDHHYDPAWHWAVVGPSSLSMAGSAADESEAKKSALFAYEHLSALADLATKGRIWKAGPSDSEMIYAQRVPFANDQRDVSACPMCGSYDAHDHSVAEIVNGLRVATSASTSAATLIAKLAAMKVGPES